jgi:hypothetical protein
MKSKPLPLYDRSAQELLSAVGSWEELARRVHDLRTGPNQFLQVAVVGCREDLPLVLQSRRAPSGLRLLQATGAVSRFAYTHRPGRRVVSGEFAVVRPDTPPIYAIVFVNARSFWRLAVAPLIDSLYSRVASPFLTQSELQDILRAVNNASQPGGIRILEHSSKKRLAPGARKKFQTIREWTDESLESAFTAAKETNNWFRSITFEIVRRVDGRSVSTGSKCVISKYGYVACNQDLKMYFDLVLNQVITIAGQRLEFFSHRDRVSTANALPRPLEIHYEIDALRNVEQTKKLVAVLRKFRQGTCTVLHANPYLHLSVVDNLDFSSADVWVLSPRQIIVVPQIRASEPALKRIVNHIFENFREGKLSEYAEAV